MALLRSIQEFLGIAEPEPEDERERAPRTEEERADGKEAPPPSDRAPAAARHPLMAQSRALVGIFEGLLHKLETIDFRLESLQRVEAAVGGMNGMVQFVAKGGEKRDRELRAHITTELDKLGASLRLDASKQGALDVFKALLPSLDDMDHVLKESSAEENKSLAIVQKKLKDAFAKLGIDEIVVEEEKTHFDSELHDGEPYKGEGAAGVEKGTVVQVARAGYKMGDLLIRASKVLVKE